MLATLLATLNQKQHNHAARECTPKAETLIGCRVILFKGFIARDESVVKFRKPAKSDQPVGPYNPRHLQDLQKRLEAERQREFDERERAFYAGLTPEQKAEHDEYDNTIQRWGKALDIDDGNTYVVDNKARIAKRIGVSVRTLNRWITCGKVEIEPMSRQRWRISEAEIERLAGS
ncbi:MAG: hypothetical protein JXM70_20960 [Pirellulales bacterium]|nr:hypothetical protein [Pirellulales bacterium]